MGASDIAVSGGHGFAWRADLRRLYAAYVLGAVLGLGAELMAVWLYLSPSWKPLATAWVGG